MREQKILEALQNSTQHLSLEYFSKLLQVSTRTISNDMKNLMQDGERNGFEIHLKRKVGYYLHITNQEKFHNYLHQEREEFAINAKDRVDTITAFLLLETNFLTQDGIADVLQVSKSIIKVDMAKVEKNLIMHNMQLVKKAHYGITLSSDCMQRKLYLMELYEQENPYTVKIIDETIKVFDIRILEKQLIVLLKQYHLNTNYIELKKLDMFLKICLCIAKKDINKQTDRQLEDTLYTHMTQDLANIIYNAYQLHITNEDIYNIANYLKQKTKPNEVELLYDAQLKQDIEAFLQEADMEYQTRFNEDEEFKKSLLAHTSLLLDRLHQSISFSNPLVHEISVKYPVIFNICIKFAGMLESRYHVKTTQDEIGFIATHFAAHMEKELHMKLNSFSRLAIICSSGGGSAFLIKLKLEIIFSSSQIQTFSLLEMDEVRNFQPDIIFTIKQLDETFTVPIVLIKELLDDEDIQKIKNMFEFSGSSGLLKTEKSFASLFGKDAFKIYHDMTYPEIIHEMAKHIEEEGYSEKGYANLVMDREEVLSTVYANGVAIPHPIDMCGRKNLLSVGIVKHELLHEHKEVKLIFLVNLEKGDLEFHQNITRVLFDVMSDDSFVDKIRTSDSYEDFMKTISHLKL